MSIKNQDCCINNYISIRYDRWLEYATYHCRVSRLPIEPIEVLNEVLCSLLEREPSELEYLVSLHKNGYTELDYLVLHIIKTNIHSPRSKFRYTKGQHCTHNISGNESYISALATVDDDFDVLNSYNIVKDVFESLEISDRSKQIFAWKFFDDQSYSDWQGNESSKYLYDTFNRVLLIISAKIQRKLKE